ncbi:MAG: hypothetical protein EOO60_01340 [Hymenobacter sp.]|nr:MAG: hypothetical protein EOO60_01340 [Hymenobacter sp.]
MLLNSLNFQTGGRCELSFQKPQGWLRATWTGYVGTEEALQGGQNYLQQAGPLHCLYLLNDNAALHGPWFDSLEWLRSVWLPQAQRMGLRYVAHVVQADTHTDILARDGLPNLLNELELQLFDDVATAEDWLHSCQLPRLPAAAGPLRHHLPAGS